MNEGQAALETALNQFDKLRGNLTKSKKPQVRTAEERSIIKATAFAWFNSHRPILEASIGKNAIEEVDLLCNSLLESSDKLASRSKFKNILKSLKDKLTEIRTKNIILLANPTTTLDNPPSFSSLIAEPEMYNIIERRWRECSICVKSNAPLAATVMMGGLVESLLLARINKLIDKKVVFTAKSAPKDKRGKTLPLQEWCLKNYIDVSHELGWISQTEKDLGEVLRDYRNYIHPYKERSHNIKLEQKDAALLWELCKSISKQILQSAI